MEFIKKHLPAFVVGVLLATSCFAIWFVLVVNAQLKALVPIVNQHQQVLQQIVDMINSNKK